MKKVELYISNGYVGCTIKKVYEFEDDDTEEYIEEFFQDEIWNHIEWGWNVEDE